MSDGGLSLALTADDRAPGVARQFVSAVAAGLPSDVVARVVLLTSEVVTNAVRHGKPEIRLEVDRNPSGLTVSVHDQGEYLPMSASMPALLSTGGRGLPIVETLAAQWGVSNLGPNAGKAVWFRVE